MSGTTPLLGLTVADAARALGVSERTLWRWIESGELRSFKKGGIRRVPVEALEELVRDGMVLAKPRVAPDGGTGRPPGGSRRRPGKRLRDYR